MDRRQFLLGTAAAAALVVFPTAAEAAGPVTVVKVSPNEAAMKEAAKRTTTGAATDAAGGAAAGAAQGEVQRRTGGFGGLIRRVPGAGDAIDNVQNRVRNAFTDNGKGLTVLIQDEIKKAQAAKAPAAVFFGAEAQSAGVKTALETSNATNSVLIIVDGANDKKLRDAIANINEEHAALGTPLVQIYVVNADPAKPTATLNGFQVNKDAVNNVLASAPATPAAPAAAPAGTPPAQQGGNQNRRAPGGGAPDAQP
jgi:hypothetical protein